MMDSVSRIVSFIAESSTTKKIKDLDQQDLKICCDKKLANFDKTSLKSNPFAIFFSKLLDDVSDICLSQFDDENLLKIIELQREFKEFGTNALPLIKRIMFMIYQKKLDQERFQVFHQVYPICYTNALARLIEDTRGIRDSCLMKYLKDMDTKDMDFEEFKKYMEKYWSELIEEAKTRVFCYHCLKPAEFYCCPWRIYCSEECQKVEKEHYSKHSVLHKNETSDVMDKRCISKRIGKPMPKLEFPQFPDENDVFMK